MSDLLIDGLDSEIAEFLSVTNDFLTDRDPVDYVRRHLNDASAVESFDRRTWQSQAQLGWTGIALPESSGGSGYPLSAAGRLLQVCGRYLVPEPVLSTVGLSVPVLLAQDSTAAAELLARVAAGECVMAVAGVTEISSEDPPRGVELIDRGESAVLTGALAVLDVPGADIVLVAAGSDAERCWLAVDPSDATKCATRTLVDGRSMAELMFDGVEVPASSVLGPARAADEAWAPILTAGAVLTSAWLLGITEQAFDLTMSYLKTRSQFGALIGSYQALQHRAARMYCELEIARSVVATALAALDSGADNAALWASAAKKRLSDLAIRVTSEAIQLHGGIGMTHEADAGLYFKAAHTASTIAGDAMFHRARASRLLDITAATKRTP
jgi:alkylation response protein AidB-like acyl-CoA dehydrogenase